MVREQMFSMCTYGEQNMRKLVVSSRNIYFASKNVNRRRKVTPAYDEMWWSVKWCWDCWQRSGSYNVMEWEEALGLLTAQWELKCEPINRGSLKRQRIRIFVPTIWTWRAEIKLAVQTSHILLHSISRHQEYLITCKSFPTPKILRLSFLHFNWNTYNIAWLFCWPSHLGLP